MEPISFKALPLSNFTVPRRIIGIRSEYKNKPETLEMDLLPLAGFLAVEKHGS